MERRLAILKDNLSSSSAIKPWEFNYSNFGYMIAACMAEQVTGLSWESLMKQRLFDPLGMTSAGFGEPDAHTSTDQPWGHSGSEGKWQPGRVSICILKDHDHGLRAEIENAVSSDSFCIGFYHL